MSDLVKRLEPCPFCAGIADDTHAGVAPELHEDSHTNIYVWCPNCGAKGLVVVGSHGGTREEAIAAWNRRAESPELTRLRSEVERLTRERKVYTVYDWAWTDETGQEHYARTPERAERLIKAGHKLTPVYTLFNELKEKDNGPERD